MQHIACISNPQMGELEVFFFTYIRKNAMQSQDNGLQESVFAEHSHAFLHIVQ